MQRGLDSCSNWKQQGIWTWGTKTPGEKQLVNFLQAKFDDNDNKLKLKGQLKLTNQKPRGDSYCGNNNKPPFNLQYNGLKGCNKKDTSNKQGQKRDEV